MPTKNHRLGAPEAEIIPSNVAILIATAPRDGRVFMALDYLGEPYLVSADECAYFNNYDGEKLEELKWWMPIPTIPRSV